VKGRRRARQAALQALYELDLTDHPPERVLDGRLREFYRSNAARQLERGDRCAVELLIDEHAATHFARVELDQIASRCRTSVEAVERVLGFLRELQPHAEYCVWIVRGVMAHLDALDAVIERIAPEWPVEQMAPVDRNVLRIALWEIGVAASPYRVAINEAVELARLFSGEPSRRMVNGALGAYVAGTARLQLPPEAAHSP
jgi:N utilization substance protein B